MERGLTGPLSISSPQLADFYSAAVACVRSAVDRRTALAAKVRHDNRVHLIAFLPSSLSRLVSSIAHFGFLIHWESFDVRVILLTVPRRQPSLRARLTGWLRMGYGQELEGASLIAASLSRDKRHVGGQRRKAHSPQPVPDGTLEAAIRSAATPWTPRLRSGLQAIIFACHPHFVEHDS
jgi:hypothetical protein